MNYPVTSTNNRYIAASFFRIGVIIALVFFIGYFIVEAFSFIRLFEVTVVANPAMNIIK